MNLSLDIVTRTNFVYKLSLSFSRSLSVVYKFKREYITTLNVDRMIEAFGVFPSLYNAPQKLSFLLLRVWSASMTALKLQIQMGKENDMINED